VTVRELLTKLKSFPPDHKISLWCDWAGDLTQAGLYNERVILADDSARIPCTENVQPPATNEGENPPRVGCL